MQNGSTGCFGARHECSWIAPEERNDTNAFGETNVQPLLLWKFQVEVDAEWPGRERTSLSNLLPNSCEVRPPQYEHAKRAGITHRGCKSRPNNAAAHWSLDDWQLNSETIAKSRLHWTCSLPTDVPPRMKR